MRRITKLTAVVGFTALMATQSSWAQTDTSGITSDQTAPASEISTANTPDAPTAEQIQNYTWGVFRENADMLPVNQRNCWTQAMVSGSTINGELLAEQITQAAAEKTMRREARHGSCASSRSAVDWVARDETTVDAPVPGRHHHHHQNDNWNSAGGGNGGVNGGSNGGDWTGSGGAGSGSWASGDSGGSSGAGTTSGNWSGANWGSGSGNGAVAGTGAGTGGGDWTTGSGFGAGWNNGNGPGGAGSTGTVGASGGAVDTTAAASDSGSGAAPATGTDNGLGNAIDPNAGTGTDTGTVVSNGNGG